MDFGWRAASLIARINNNGIGKMKRIRKLLKLTIKLVVFAGIVVGGYYGYTIYTAAEEEEGLGELPTVLAQVRDITVSVSATGTLEPVRIVEVKSKASGEIIEMPVEMGDFVQAGELIVQVDTRILTQELKQAEADHQSAQVRLDISGKQYGRAQKLHEQDLISENDLEQSQQNFTNAEGQLLRAEASLQLAVERLEDATVRAPITGTIIAKTVEQGQIITSSTSNVSGGTTLVSMADLSELQVRTLVDEVDIGQVKAGLEVQSTVEAFPEMEFGGEVMKIEPRSVVQQSVTTFPVLSRIDNADGLLLPGMNADVEIVIYRRPGVLAVVNEAIRTPQDAVQIAELLGMEAGGEEMLAAGGERRSGQRGGGSGRPDRNAAGQGGGEGRRGESRAGGDGNGTNSSDHDAGVAAAGERRSGQRRGCEGLQNMSAEDRRRFQEVMRQRREEAEAAARDPWGLQRGRREPAVVFVLGADGSVVPRQIVAGVRDWEYTEIMSGLEAGEEIVLLPSTSLLRSEEEMRRRFSGRSMIPGMPGGGGFRRR